MIFTYYWKTSNNDRHTGEIEAPDREAAFSMLRERAFALSRWSRKVGRLVKGILA